MSRLYAAAVIALLLAFLTSTALAAKLPVKEGERGEVVRRVQELLIKEGYLSAGDDDGVCGQITVAAIKKFQKEHDMDDDGICGVATFKALNRAQGFKALEEGDRGDFARLVQGLLIKKGYLESGEDDGVYGKMTVAAVKKFQKEHGMEDDGVCGSLTYLELSLDQDDASPSVEPAPSQAQPQTSFEIAPEPETKPTTVIKPWQKTTLTEEEIFTHKGYVVYVEATAYSPEDPGLSHRTASGTRVRRGVIAVDPRFIPLGTRVIIPGYGEAIAEDIGADIKGNLIDVAFDTRAEALAFGRQELEIFIIEEE